MAQKQKLSRTKRKRVQKYKRWTRFQQGCITAFQTPSRGRGGREAVKAAWFYAASRVKKQAVLIKKNYLLRFICYENNKLLKTQQNLTEFELFSVSRLQFHQISGVVLCIPCIPWIPRNWAKIVKMLEILRVFEIFGHLHTMNSLIWTFHTMIFSENYAPVGGGTRLGENALLPI